MSVINMPPQQLPFNRKTVKWRRSVIDWADSRTFFNYSPVRNSIMHKKTNYDLINGVLHMEDLVSVINPDGIKATYIPDSIPHYPIMNSKLHVLEGEEIKRVFDFRVIVTNPNAVSEIEEHKQSDIFNRLQTLVSNTAQTEEEYTAELDKLNHYYQYKWQDIKEIRDNALLNHFYKEYDIPLLFNQGFIDAETVGEEMYQCDIIGGEPVIKKLNPLKVSVFRSGFSNKVEDADMIVIEDYWSPGKIIDTFYDSLTRKDIEYLEKYAPDNTSTDSMDNIDERRGFVPNIENVDFFQDSTFNTKMPYDLDGNIKVLQVYWKSRRRIKKVKSYDHETGEETYGFYPETYILNKDAGEEEQIFYINEAWEGTKIGTDIYVNMKPRVIQYNRLSNPSRCHFGIIGTIYNINESRPFSLVDMMKPYNYLYDVVHNKLNKLIAQNWGKLVRMDLAKVPAKWSVDKWLHFAKTMGLLIEDSFKEGDRGAAMNKLAGALNNASHGVVDAELGNSIQANIMLLEHIKNDMAEVVGISKQREGQISNRETVGGVERATLQSSYITEWIFSQHEDLKKRVLESFLETAKIAYKGRTVKFQYILPDSSIKFIEIDGDEFAEADYGLVVDNSQTTQALSQKLDTLAQAALQNQMLSFSTIMKLYSSSSLAEKQIMIEENEREMQERTSQTQQQQLAAQQQLAKEQAQEKQAELEQREQANIRDNETRILIAHIQASNNSDDTKSLENENILQEKIREFDERLKLDKDRFEQERLMETKELKLKEKQINNKKTNNGKS